MSTVTTKPRKAMPARARCEVRVVRAQRVGWSKDAIALVKLGFECLIARLDRNNAMLKENDRLLKDIDARVAHVEAKRKRPQNR